MSYKLTKEILEQYAVKNNHINTYILKEMLNQYYKWGIQDHKAMQWLSILIEEIGECAKEINEFNVKKLTDELIQSGAVIFSWLLSILEDFDINLDESKVSEQFKQYFNLSIISNETEVNISNEHNINKGD